MKPTDHPQDKRARLLLGGLLAIQVAVGYEWLVSGLTKVVRSGFAPGLGDELAEKSAGAPGWFARLLEEIVIPNGTGFGYAIEIAEIVVGLALIGGAGIWFASLPRLGRRTRRGLFVTIALAALSGSLLNVAFHLANGSPHPWLIPEDGFDEGVDLDSLMPAIQVVLAFVALRMLMLEAASQSTRPQESSTSGRRSPSTAAP